MYARLSRITLDLETLLGHGNDGSVWTSNRKTAVKAIEREHNYTTELECYQRFKEHRVTRIQGFSVPELIGFDDDLWIVEMRIVTPPFILDFAKAHLDRPHEFSEEGREEWEQYSSELFDDKWPDVCSLLRSLRQYGIYYYDAKPANIMFAKPPEIMGD